MKTSKRVEYLFWATVNIAAGLGIILVSIDVIGWWLVWSTLVLFPVTWFRYWILGGRRF